MVTHIVVTETSYTKIALVDYGVGFGGYYYGWALATGTDVTTAAGSVVVNSSHALYVITTYLSNLCLVHCLSLSSQFRGLVPSFPSATQVNIWQKVSAMLHSTTTLALKNCSNCSSLQGNDVRNLLHCTGLKTEL